MVAMISHSSYPMSLLCRLLSDQPSCTCKPELPQQVRVEAVMENETKRGVVENRECTQCPLCKRQTQFMGFYTARLLRMPPDAVNAKYKRSWKPQSGTKQSCHPDVKPATACRRAVPRLVTLRSLFMNCLLNLEESCMITQFTGTIIKSLASSLFHYIETALECFLHDQRQNLLPGWVTEHTVASEGATAWYAPPCLHSFRGPQ